MFEYLKLSCLHSRLRKEFGSITLPHNLHKDMRNSEANKNDEDTTNIVSKKAPETSLGLLLLSIKDEKMKKKIQESKEKRMKIKSEFLNSLQWFYKKLLELGS